jgi:hypothetical protein
MIEKTFSTGSIRKLTFDPDTRQLEVEWQNKRIRAFKPVPEEIFRRLSSAPNPDTYFHDRIVEEYAEVQPRRRATEENPFRALNDLFGSSKQDGT